MHPFTIKECLSFGWTTFKKRPGFFVGTFLVYALVQIALSIVQNEVPGIVSFLLSMIASTLLYIGLITVYLKAYVDPMAPTLQELWRPGPFWRYLFGSLLIAGIVIGGLILLIIPGVFFAVAFAFTGYLIIDKDMQPVRALKESARLTKGHRWKLFQLGLVLILISLIGALPLFLGLLVAGPVSMLAGIHAYRLLEKAAGEVKPVSEPVVD